MDGVDPALSNPIILRVSGVQPDASQGSLDFLKASLKNTTGISPILLELITFNSEHGIFLLKLGIFPLN